MAARKQRKKAVAALPAEAPAKYFQPLESALERWFDKPFAKLTAKLRKRVELNLLMHKSWDGLTPEQRRSVAQSWDYQNDPATESEREFWWELAV